MRLFHRPGPRLSVCCLATCPLPPQALLLAHHPFLSGWRIPVVVPRLLLGSHVIAPLFLLTSEALTLIDSEYFASALSDGFISPRPPTRTGNRVFKIEERGRPEERHGRRGPGSNLRCSRSSAAGKLS